MKGNFMKGLSSNRAKEINAIRDEDIDYSDIPPLDAAWFKTAKIVHPKAKKPISLRVDQAMYEWYKEQSNGSGYQSLMHAVLHGYYVANAQNEKEKR
jgi:uncharacterized protein (DUF4415 family)